MSPEKQNGCPIVGPPDLVCSMNHPQAPIKNSPNAENQNITYKPHLANGLKIPFWRYRHYQGTPYFYRNKYPRRYEAKF